MSRHDAERHGERLQEVLARGDEARIAFEGSELASCDTCRSFLEATMDTIDRMDALGRFERAERDAFEQAKLDVAPGSAEERVREQVLAQLRGRAPARRRWAWVGAAAAAVLALVAALYVFAPGDGGDGGGGPMLGDGFELLHPAGAVEGDSFGTFRWSGALPPGGWYKIKVFGETEPGRFDLLDESGRLREPRWAPDPTEEARWPARIRWMLEVYDGSNASRGFETHRQDAELSSR